MAFSDVSIGEFLDRVASRRTTPSGGAVAAVCGAAGAALCEMVCLHALARDGDADARTDADPAPDELAAGLADRRARLLALADEDAAAVEAVQAALDAPDDENRDERVREAAVRATEVPLATAEASLAVLEAATAVVEAGNENALADAATGAFLARAALEASVTTVRANLPMVADAAFVEETESRLTQLEADARRAADEVRARLPDGG